MSFLLPIASFSLLPLLLLFLPSLALCHFRANFPPFLQKVSAEQRRQYNEIVTSTNVTKAVITTNMQNWASTAGVASDYNNFTSAHQQRAVQFHDAIAGNLTDQALQLFNNLWSIRQNDQITRLAECQQIQTALNATGWDQMLQRLVPIPPPAIIGPPPPGCFPRPPHSMVPFGNGFGPKPFPRRPPMAKGNRNTGGTENGEEERRSD